MGHYSFFHFIDDPDHKVETMTRDEFFRAAENILFQLDDDDDAEENFLGRTYGLHEWMRHRFLNRAGRQYEMPELIEMSMDDVESLRQVDDQGGDVLSPICLLKLKLKLARHLVEHPHRRVFYSFG